ncbi:MAG TPA: STM3941 family protein [Candidatus Polarisedimenticolia bacterium]|nr:STM3941 family protein [Candidatus Polarisedimenticolia bacterium]
MLESRVTPGGDLVIFPDRRKLILVLLGAAGFVAVSAWLLTLHVGWMAGARVVPAAIAGIGFFGLVFLYCVYRLVRWRPALIIDADGIVEQSSLISVGRLRWEEVDCVVPYVFRGQPMLGIVPRDPQAVMARAGWIGRMAMKANGPLGCAPINVAQVTLPGTTEELALLLAGRYGVTVKRSPGDAGF